MRSRYKGLLDCRKEMRSGVGIESNKERKDRRNKKKKKRIPSGET